MSRGLHLSEKEAARVGIIPTRSTRAPAPTPEPEPVRSYRGGRYDRSEAHSAAFAVIVSGLVGWLMGFGCGLRAIH